MRAVVVITDSAVLPTFERAFVADGVAEATKIYVVPAEEG